MKLNPNCFLNLATLGVPVLLLAQAANAATTILNADGQPRLNTAPPSFGSNISASNGNFSVSAGIAGIVGTPGIALAWGGSNAWDPYGGWDGRGSVIQAETYDNSQTLALSFTPTATAAVLLNSVDFDEWGGGGAMSITWSVTGPSSGTLASGVWTRSSSGRDNIALNATGAFGEALTFRLTNTDGVGSGSYFAIDNLAFDQVPETSGALLGVLGLGALVMNRRRR